MFHVEICSLQLEICKSVCMFIVLTIVVEAFGCFVPMIADHDLMTKKINNHGCWGKHAHIPDNDYWGICLFNVVWTIFFLQLFLCGTHGIYFHLHPTFCSSTEQCAWAKIFSTKEFKSWATCISFALLPDWQNYLLSNILWFDLKIWFWADF
jgi:hypothetical protein